MRDLQIRQAKAGPKLRKMADGGGLFLLIYPSGRKAWAYSYMLRRKQKVEYFGNWPKVSLADARAMLAEAKERVKQERWAGPDAPAAAPAPTFEEVAKEWLAAQAVAWTPAHLLRVQSRFVDDVFPEFGATPVAKVTAPQILAALRKIEDRGALDVAKRVRQSIGAVMRYAIATGRAERDPAADLRNALKPSPRVKHLAALKAGEIGDFMAALRLYDGEAQTALAIELVMHTFVRTGEIRFGKWSEIDGDLWRIPAERMKMHRDHIVPLTPQSLAILGRLKMLAGDSEWIVPGEGGKPISENTMLFALYRMGYHKRATIHGMRGLASTCLNESGLWSPDAIERQLAHVPGDSVRAAYNAAQHLPERKRMMQWWSDYLENAEGAAKKQRKPRNLKKLLG